MFYFSRVNTSYGFIEDLPATNTKLSRKLWHNQFTLDNSQQRSNSTKNTKNNEIRNLKKKKQEKDNLDLRNYFMPKNNGTISFFYSLKTTKM